jgi:serine/threonine-protein kinase
VALTPDTRLGAYEVVSLLGEGGMGEVYRARDTKLGRDVALKILPEAFTLDGARIARFRREAHVLASLNHPNIAAIYGFEDSGSTHALVLELVEGPTLADRIAKGPLPLDEARPIAKQIAEALEAAHEQGIIHRDLKPANIKVRSDGTVKVLDFGLAKAIEAGGAEQAGGAGREIPSMSPTITSPAIMTGVGMILGTAAYMAPEQARGRHVDRRADIWAFGAVLFEMLTGSQAFPGQDIPHVLARVIEREPDWSTLPASLPPALVTYVRRCLVKDPRERVRDIGDVRLALDGAFELPAQRIVESAATAPTVVPAPRWRRVGAYLAALLAGAAVTAAAAWVVARTRAQPLQPVRFALVPPPTAALTVGGNERTIAISPDGTHIVYRGSGGSGSTPLLLARAIDQLDARPIATIPRGFREPFLSPDGQWVGFFLQGEIRKVSINGGPSIAIAKNSAAPRGASWGPDGTIIFATNDAATGLLSVPAGGGEPTVLTTPDTAHGAVDHVFPSILPGGAAVLYTVTSTGQPENAQIAVLDLKSGQSKILIRGGSQAEYLESGHLIYAAAGTLRAVRFDLKRLEVVSDPVPLIEQVLTPAVSGEAMFAISRTGTLVYVPSGPGTGSSGPPRSLVWVDRHGKEEAINAPPRAYTNPRLSPDDTRIAIDVFDQENDIWTWDLGRQTLTRLTFDPGLDRYPVWTADGRAIIYSSQRAGAPNLFRQSADGTGAAERLTTTSTMAEADAPTSVSPDGTRMVLELAGEGGRRDDIFLLPLAGKAQAVPLIRTTFDERNAEISPDGRWIAYESNESGQYQIYVRPFPNVDSGRWQISNGGGSCPAWARNGRELFYLDQAGALTGVPVQASGTTVAAGTPTKILEPRYFRPSGDIGNTARTYDVSRDGRFLMVKDTEGSRDQNAPPASMVVAVNWIEELKRLAPAK